MTLQDASNGYEARADAYVAARSRDMGLDIVRNWAKRIPPGSRILDLGCGHGVPLADALAKDGFALCGVDASPTLLSAYKDNIPGAQTELSRVQESTFLDASFHGILAWGLLFLLDPVDQELIIGRVGSALMKKGTFLFTAPSQEVEWEDVLTQQTSRSMGTANYNRMLRNHGMWVEAEIEDEGGNHYYIARKESGA